MEYKTFTTSRLELRPTTIADAAFILKLVNTPKWINNIGDRNVNTVAEAITYIETKMHPQLERLGFGNYTMTRKIDDTKIGTCGLYDRDGLEGFDIGFALLPEFERKGYGFEAAKKIMRVAFEDFGIMSISGITTHENVASQKLLEKLGLEYTGTTKIPNDPEELLLYKITT